MKSSYPNYIYIKKKTSDEYKKFPTMILFNLQISRAKVLDGRQIRREWEKEINRERDGER